MHTLTWTSLPSARPRSVFSWSWLGEGGHATSAVGALRLEGRDGFVGLVEIQS